MFLRRKYIYVIDAGLGMVYQGEPYETRDAAMDAADKRCNELPHDSMRVCVVPVEVNAVTGTVIVRYQGELMPFRWARPMPRTMPLFHYKFKRFVVCWECKGKATLWEATPSLLYVLCTCDAFVSPIGLATARGHLCPKLVMKMPEPWGRRKEK